MSSGTPFIGSKISLISRAEIRYEGILYQVDTKESTVTLAKVRSFGTEDRPSTKQIPPRNEVYEFIIFRANDIKDLNVSEMPDEPNSPPQDPAILSAQSIAPIPPSTAAPSGVDISQPPPAHTPQPPVQHNAHSHYYPHPQNMGNYSPFGMGMPYYRPPVMMGTGGPHPPHPGMHQPRPVTATNQGMPPPVVPPHVSVIGAPPTQSHTPPRPVPSTTTLPSGFVATPTYAAPAGVETKPQASSTPVVDVAEPTQVSQSISSAVNAHSENMNDAPDSSQPLPPSRPRDSVQTNTQRREREDFTDRRKQQGQARWDRGGGGGGNNRGDNRSGRGYYRERRENNYHKSRGDDGEGSGRGGYNRQQQQGARGGHNYQQQGGRGGHSYRQQQNNPANSAKPAPFKYDSDFDFESANARFKKENLEQEFEKLRLDSGSSRKASAETLGEGEEPGVGSDDEVVIVEEGEVVEEVEECYDKSKSFFDNISCEGSSNKRHSRSEEREVNMETFGVSGVNRGYRNRRGGRWRGYRGRYSGGWSNDGDGGRQGGRHPTGNEGGNRQGYQGGNRQGYHSGERQGYQGGERQGYHGNGTRRGDYHGNRRGGGYNRENEVEREA